MVRFFNTLFHDSQSSRIVYGSHSFHEVTMYYPMRSLRTSCYKLIHNLNNAMPFPIDQDFYISPTFQDMLFRTKCHKPLKWIKTLHQYYQRDAWELYDVCHDNGELHNLAEERRYVSVLRRLQELLLVWQTNTTDPWICSPGAVLEDTGAYKQHPQCMSLYNGY